MRKLLRLLFKILLPVLVLAIAVQVGRFMVAQSPESEPEAPVQEAGQSGDIATVSVQSIERLAVAPEVRLFGRVSPDRRVQIAPVSSARVDTVDVRAGHTVSAGQVLYTLETEDLERNVSQQQSRLRRLEASVREEKRAREAARDQLASERRLVALAEQAVDRTTNLRGRNLASAADLDAAEQNLETRRQALRRQQLAVAGADDRVLRQEAQLDEARVQAEQLNSDLAAAQVASPMDGWVVSVSVAAGERLSAGQGVEVVSATPVWIDAVVPLSLADKLSRGMAASWQHADDEQAGQAVLDRWVPQSDRGRIRVSFRVTSPIDPQVLPYGTTVAAWLSLPVVDDVVVLPEQAVYGGDTIYRVASGALEPVAAGLIGYRHSGEGVSAIVSAPELQSGENVLVTRLPEAVSGLPVLVAGDGS